MKHASYTGTRNARAFAASLPLALLLALFAGCEGPQGPAGEGVEDLDTTPPSVALLSPARSDTVYSDTLTVTASAQDSESGILFVEFFLDGTSSLGGASVALDSSQPYSVTWDLAASGHGYGVFPLIARAVDQSFNTMDTPPVLITHLPRPSQQLLDYFGAGEESHLTMPNNFGDRYYNVRFTPPDSCRVLEVRVEVRDPGGARFPPFAGEDQGDAVTGGAGLTVFLWASQQGEPFPDWSRRDSVELAQEEVVLDGWTSVDFSATGLGPFGGDFHAGVNAPHGQYDTLYEERRAAPILIHVDPNPLANPANHRSSQYVPDQGWGTMQSLWSNTKIDLHLRALVEYLDGSTALIAPDGSPIEEAR